MALKEDSCVPHVFIILLISREVPRIVILIENHPNVALKIFDTEQSAEWEKTVSLKPHPTKCGF